MLPKSYSACLSLRLVADISVVPSYSMPDSEQDLDSVFWDGTRLEVLRSKIHLGILDLASALRVLHSRLDR